MKSLYLTAVMPLIASADLVPIGAGHKQLNTIRQTPLVQTYGSSYHRGVDGDWGIDLEFNADLSAGYTAVFFWLLANNEN